MTAVDARTASLRLLSRREHSETELIRKLLDRGFEPDVANSTVAELSSRNIVSNERFTEEFVRVRIERGMGPMKLASELKHRGIGGELITRSVKFDDPRWKERIEKVVLRKYRDKPIDSYREWARRARFLQGRGFTSAQISAALGRYSDMN